MADARERKRKEKPKSVSRHPSKVRVVQAADPDKARKNKLKAWQPEMKKPSGLSPAALWDKLREDEKLTAIHPLDWIRLYPGDNSDQEEWPHWIGVIRDCLENDEIEILLSSEWPEQEEPDNAT